MSTNTTILQSTGTMQARAVFDAVTAANYAVNGAPFDPLLIKFTSAKHLTNGWNSETGDTQISFYQFPDPADRSDQFLPLGDIASINNADSSKTPVMLVAPAPGQENMLAHPTGFNWILDDNHSGNSNDIAYFWPQAPDGYQAMGVCVGFNGATPNVENYWCVNVNLLRDVPTRSFWSDSGQGWSSHDGGLNVADLSNIPSNDKFLVAPTTILSVEGGNPGLCLILDKLMLPIAAIPAPELTYEFPSEEQTAKGLSSVAVLPCTAIADSNLGTTPLTDPFYYLASEPFWAMAQGDPAVKGGEYTQKLTVGTSSEKSTGFQDTTSITVGADVGVDADGFSAHMSVSYTDEMQVTSQSTIGTNTEMETEVKLELPVAKHIFIWQSMASIVAYRTRGTAAEGADLLSSVDFQKNVADFTASPS